MEVLPLVIGSALSMAVQVAHRIPFLFSCEEIQEESIPFLCFIGE